MMSVYLPRGIPHIHLHMTLWGYIIKENKMLFQVLVFATIYFPLYVIFASFLGLFFWVYQKSRWFRMSKKIPMREAPDLFIACNKSRIGRAKLIRTKYRSGKIHFPRFHKSLVWPFSWTNNSKKVWRYKVPSMYHLLGHWCLCHIA